MISVLDRYFFQEKLKILYPENHPEVLLKIIDLIEKWNQTIGLSIRRPWVDERDVMLITYGDSLCKPGEAPLATSLRFLHLYLRDIISAIHILPMFPYTSDDGFSVVDYYQINPALGTWENVLELSQEYDLMYDAVINHVSKSSEWFQGYLAGKPEYDNFFIDIAPTIDLSMVIRPRTFPLLTEFQSRQGVRHIWTTFSQDQIDLNYRNPAVFLEILNVLLTYAHSGARFIRLDAAGLLWKEPGTTSINLPETHVLVKLIRRVLELVFPGTILITETNVPQADNISYFGDGYDEAQLVYQFPLPPLVLFSFLTENAKKLSCWADSLKNNPLTPATTYLNFLASHDGIGMRPTEGILSDAERQFMVEMALRHGGLVGYRDNGDGTQSPYELNINYLDALTDPSSPDTEARIARFIASQAILLSVVGIPGIYIHSLLGSQNWYEGVRESGINRRINREKLDYDKIGIELANPFSLRSQVFRRYLHLLKIRRAEASFSPGAKQEILFLDDRVFSLVRKTSAPLAELIVLINVSDDIVLLDIAQRAGYDLITATYVKLAEIMLHSYQVMWIKCV